jgi:hypothetical protein
VTVAALGVRLVLGIGYDFLSSARPRSAVDRRGVAAGHGMIGVVRHGATGALREHRYRCGRSQRLDALLTMELADNGAARSRSPMACPGPRGVRALR